MQLRLCSNNVMYGIQIISYLNQQLIVSILQNQSVTDRQGNYYNPLAHAGVAEQIGMAMSPDPFPA